MPAPELIIGAAIVVSLVAYALTGGADFGGGVWDLLAAGPRAADQRRLITRAIGPIWEANHVWLILVVVLTFVAFPRAFAAMGTALHIPIVVMLVGIVLRGSAFIFRTYDPAGDGLRPVWSRTFAISSTVTPVMLGVILGAVASGRFRFDARLEVVTDFVSEWLAPFPWAVGLFTLTLFAFLAAVYLTGEADQTNLREDFRRRALGAALAVGAAAWLCFALAAKGAPTLFAGLAKAWWSAPFQVLTAAVAVGAMVALWKRRYGIARLLAVAQVTLVILGWAGAQYPYVIVDSIDVHNHAAPAAVLRPLVWTLGAGLAVVLPGLWYLFRVFKGRPQQT